MVSGRKQRGLALWIKRAIDVVVAGLALLVASPLMLLLFILVKATSRGPAIFRQERVGIGGAPFILYKFRSMKTGVAAIRAADGSNVALARDSRLTPIGYWLRLTSLDELPQFWNVLKGDMSLVGPRPDETAHLQFYTPLHYRKLEVRPGVTSLAMIKGRNAITWEERTRWEVYYIDHWSLWLDLKIMLLTVPVVLLRRGIYQADGAAGVRS